MRKCNNCLLPETDETLVIALDGKSFNKCTTTQLEQTGIDWDKRMFKKLGADSQLVYH